MASGVQNHNTNLLPSDEHNNNSEKKSKCDQCNEKEARIQLLENELQDWKQRFLDAESSANEARDEIKSMEHEMEEMKDSFREEESVQFEQLKKEFEVEAKKCKILQFRLNKCERQCGQLEQINLSLERQLEELRHQQQETNIRNRIDANSPTQPLHPHQQQQQQQQQQQSAFVQLGPDFVKISTREYDQLLRDLNDTSERERDLQEQVRFAQEDAQCKGDRLQAVEAENEVLLGRVSKLTLANSRLKSNLLSGSTKFGAGSGSKQDKSENEEENDLVKVTNPRELYEQNEQYRLALEMAQAECTRLNSKVQESGKVIEAKESALRKMELQLRNLETPGDSSSSGQVVLLGQQSRLELECRQLRARLVHSERECRQLKAQIELLITSGSSQAAMSNQRSASQSRSQSFEAGASSQQGCCKCGAKCNEINRRLEEQCQLVQVQKQELQKRVDQLVERSGGLKSDSMSSMESDLLEKLKRELDLSESELAKARSRLVELDLRCNQAQRQYKDLLSSLETYNADQQVVTLQRMRSRAPSDGQSDTMSRGELRQVVRELESNLDEVIAVVRVKNSLIDELKARLETYESDEDLAAPGERSSGDGASSPVDEQLKSVRRQLDQEKLTTSNLKIDVANLEEANKQMRMQVSVTERKCVVMSEELDRLRAVSGETRAELDEARRLEQCAVSRAKDYESIVSELRRELADSRKLVQQSNSTGAQQNSGKGDAAGGDRAAKQQTDLLLLSRDLSELRVKNGFLMRQLELAREDAAKQVEEVRQSSEAQQRQAIEMAQLELREKHLNDLQVLRDEIADLKQKLGSAQRQVTKQEEETSVERERVRSFERDWRRDKSQWQQKYEQLEAQLTIERRTSEFRSKEAESMVRDKERALISVQDRCVQLERDLKRLQNKYSLLEENSDSRIKTLSRDLDMKARELNEIGSIRQQVDERHFVECRRLQTEKSTLAETLDSLRRSYDERSAELKSVRDLLIVRQEQAYRERSNAQERIESLSDKLDEMSEHETQCKLLRQRLEALERHLESARDERSRLKTRCDELERKCVQYEKRELIGKTTSIVSGASSSFLRFGSSQTATGSSSSKQRSQPASSSASNDTTSKQANSESVSVVERLSGKINDQRHLINMLRQQLNETQLELKQMKLLQSSERSKWQTKCALLTSRLNECEERLAFETALIIGDRSPAVSASSTGLLDKVVRPKLEQQWSKERHSTMDQIQQQQAQIEMLARDLKKISQAHDLLRLHSKQLESHNNKLSKKLIEYQQQLVFESDKTGDRHTKELEMRVEQLKRANDRLREHARPLVKIMSKVVSSLDAPAAPVNEPTSGKTSTEPSSMSRPLRAGDATTMAAVAAASTPPEEDDSKPDASAAQQTRSRFARLLGGAPKTSAKDQATGEKEDSPENASNKKNTVRRVRIKSSTLGITPTEKRQLKDHLRELSAAMDLTATMAAASVSDTKQHSTKQASKDNSSNPQAKPTAAELYLRHVAKPQRTSGGSLTDYDESESSLASYGFGSPVTLSTLSPAGAESDSGLTTTAGSSTAHKLGGERKRRGFKSRLTNTLRNLSRSITAGLGSDSETEGSVASQPGESWNLTSKRRLKGTSSRQASVESELSVQSELGLSTSAYGSRDTTRASSALREIRV